jgi:hypothetical protein
MMRLPGVMAPSRELPVGVGEDNRDTQLWTANDVLDAGTPLARRPSTVGTWMVMAR